MAHARILIVDDDPNVRLLLGEDLEEQGHEAIFAGDGFQAVAAARRERPDLIVLDMRLPAGDGLSVLERLRNLPGTSRIPVVVFTGQQLAGLEQRARELGAHAFVQKSLTGTELAVAIGEVLERRARRSEARLADAPAGSSLGR